MASPTVDRRFGVSGNLAMKAPVTVLAASNITLQGEQTIDGIAVLASNAAGLPDRVLCTGQTDTAQNGIWDVSTGWWTRAIDANGNRDLTKGTMVFVTSGATYGGTYWKLTTSAPIVVGTTPITWTRALAGDLSTLTFTQAGIGAQSLGAQDKMREEVTTKDFGAIFDGTSHPLSERYASLALAQVDYPFATALTQEIDFCAIQAMLNALGVAGGGTGRLSPGSHYIGGETALLFSYDDVELVGYGTQSEIYIANWGTQASGAATNYTHIRVSKHTGSTITGVRIAHLKIKGTKDYIADANWYAPALWPWSAVLFGSTATDVSTNCGVEYCHFENSGGASVQAQGGSNDNAVNAVVHRGFYTRHCYMDNGVFGGVEVVGGGIRDADISHNVIRRRSGGGILYSGTSGVIDNNKLEYIGNYGIACAGYSGKGNWTHVTNNKVFRCGSGAAGGTTVTPSMYFGDGALNNFVFVDGNTITDAYGPGIFVLGSSEDIVLQNNRIHGFGYEGSGKTISIFGASWAGIEALGSTRIVVKGNTVHAISGGTDRSEYGIMVGGAGADCFADDNTTVGTFVTAPFFFSTAHSGATVRTGVRLGRNNNFDVYTRQYAKALNNLNNETLPSFTDLDTTPSVAGSKTWFCANSAPTTITALDDSTVDQEVTIIFQDANTTIADAGQFSLNGGVAPSAANLVLTLVRGTTGTWYEKSRVQT
jgi:parallel beta-helix repeat protein